MEKHCRLLCRLICLALALYVAHGAAVIEANTFTVNSTADMADSTPGDSKCETGRTLVGGSPAPECTLRAAVQESNALVGKHEIILASGAYVLSQTAPCTYRVKDNLRGLYSITETTVSLCITGQMTIKGADSSTTNIDGAQLARTLLVSADAQAEIRGVTIRGGKWDTGDFIGGGGGINNQGMLTLIESEVSGNTTNNTAPGGIYNSGTLVLNKSKVNANSGGSGGLSNNYGTAFITDRVFNENSGTSGGGGGLVNNSGTVTIIGSTFSNNVAFYGEELQIIEEHSPFSTARLAVIRVPGPGAVYLILM